MRSRYSVILFALIIGVVGFALCSHFAPREPQYQGKSLTQWLDGGYEDAAVALREIGPAAVPTIFEKLRREHPRWGRRQQYRNIWVKIPAVLQRCFPRPRTAAFDEYRACNVFLDLGPQTIPALVRGLDDRNPGVKLTSAWALGLFHDRGANVDEAVPSLVREMKAPLPEVSKRATWAMSRIRPASVRDPFQGASL